MIYSSTKSQQQRVKVIIDSFINFPDTAKHIFDFYLMFDKIGVW